MELGERAKTAGRGERAKMAVGPDVCLGAMWGSRPALVCAPWPTIELGDSEGVGQASSVKFPRYHHATQQLHAPLKLRGVPFRPLGRLLRRFAGFAGGVPLS